MDDIQGAIDYLENRLKKGISKCRRKYYETAISAMRELRQYKKLEEKELLIKLPCKIGSRIYRIYMDCPKDFKEEYCTDHEGSCGNCHHRTPVILAGAFVMQDVTEYGERVFSTREAAEKALEEIKNE